MSFSVLHKRSISAIELFFDAEQVLPTLVRDEVIRRPALLPRPRNEAGDLFGRGLKWIEVCALGARAMTKPLVCARQCPLQFPLHPYRSRQGPCSPYL